MFSKKPHADIKKSSQKATDPKKDSPTRLKHLKIYLENVDTAEAKLFFEANFSHVYYVFYDIFLNIESNLKQKAQKSHREELESILQLFEKILTLLPELIQKKWQCHSIGRVMRKLLHPANSMKLRRDGMRLFLIWYQILGTNAPDDLHLLFVNLVPDLPIVANNINSSNLPLIRPHGYVYGPAFSREVVDNMSFSSYSSENSSASAHAGSAHFDGDSGPVTLFDYGCLLPPQLGEKSVEDHTIVYFEILMELIVSQMTKIEWKDKNIYKQQHGFQFLFEKFKKYYLPHVFPQFDLESSLYKPSLGLPRLRSIDAVYSTDLTDGGTAPLAPGSPHPLHPHHPQYNQHQLVLHDRLIQCQVIVIRWVVNFTHYVKKIPHDNYASASTISDARQHSDSTSEVGRPSSSISDRGPNQEQRPDSVSSGAAHGSSVSTLSASSLMEKDSSNSIQSNDEHSYTEYMIVRDTLYASRENVNFVHEIFHQAFMLPFSYSHAMRRVVECYRDWIHMNLPELPAFMLEPLESKENSSSTKADHSATDGASDNVSQTSSSQDVIPKGWRSRTESYLVAGHQDHLTIRAGLQNLLQVFITSAANIFLLEVAEDQPHALLDEQVDMCKRILNVYRFMVMNVRMEQRTWEQLLMILLQITSLVLREVPPTKKDSCLGGRLAPALFQTLIVTWIKANLNVTITTILWDRFLVVLSSLTQWEELIREWAKTMETLTRVLARQVYDLDLNDLPLERLSEQKQKKRRGKMQPGTGPAQRTDQNMRTESNQQSNQQPTTNSSYVDKKAMDSEEIQKPIYADQQGRGSFDGRTQVDGSFSCDGTSLSNKSMFLAFSTGITRSSSDGNLTFKKGRRSSHPSTRESSVVPQSSACQIQGISPALEQEVERIISNAEAYVRENNDPIHRDRPFLVKRKSRSVDSLSNMKVNDSPITSNEFTWGADSPNRSPSPAPSTGVDSNSFKDSPMHLDALAGSDNSCSNSEIGMEQCSVMSGGSIRGWLPDVAVVLWKRMLCALGDINKIVKPEIHWQVMRYLTDLFETLLKLRENLGVTSDNMSTPPSPGLIPPITLIIPWLFQALNLDNSFEKGKLYAYRLLCTLTVRKHDIVLPQSHIIEFYKFLHQGLIGQNQDVINTIVRYCGPAFFYSNLPGATLLILDFIFAANTVASSSELEDFPRTEAVSILGSLLCFPRHYAEIPVFQPNINEPKIMPCNDVKEHLVTILLRAGKKEPAGLARCIAISSLGIYIYEELAHLTFHGRVKEALFVLLAGLRFNRAVAQVACDMLLLLKDHCAILLQKYPDLPLTIIEDVSSTLLMLLPNKDALPTNNDRKLLVSLMFCLGEWCMAVPLSIFLQSKHQEKLTTVFKVLNIAAAGKNGSADKDKNLSTTIDGLSSPQDFDPNIKIDNLRDNGSNSRNDQSKREQTMSFNPSTLTFETKSESKLIRLAACTVLYHLINHLNHFPMGIGASRLNSMINENDDLSINNSIQSELSTDVFNSSNVQLFIMNNDTLISFIEIPALEVPSSRLTEGLNTARSQVRLIIRTLSGKFSWDSTLLHSLSNVALNSTTSSAVGSSPRAQKSPSSSVRSADVMQSPSPKHRLMPQNTLQAITPTSSNLSLNVSSPNCALRQRLPEQIPTLEDSTEDVDNLDDLLQYIGHTSPECLTLGYELNIPSNPPCDLGNEVEEDAITMVLNQRNFEMDYIKKHDSDTSMMPHPIHPVRNHLPLTPFQHCRLLLMELGLLSWEKRPQFDLLKKNEKLLREIKNMDSQYCRETHKIAVIYVAEGQEDKNSVLRNCGGSQAYEEFVAGLAWEVELETHVGFMGGLQKNQSTGDTAPYYATSFMEVLFHVATRMPSNNEDSFTKKLRHLGNDEIHIVWSEHTRDYRRGIIATEFCDVLIVIYPLPNHLFRIQISRKPEVPYFGPLFNGAIVDQKILPGLVRATAINASRAKRSLIPLFQNFYEERARSIETIRKNHKDPKTFEEFSANLYDPCLNRLNHGFTAAESNFKNADVTSNLTSALIDRRPPRTPPTVPLRQRPMSLSSGTDTIAYRIGDGSPLTPRSASYNVSPPV